MAPGPTLPILGEPADTPRMRQAPPWLAQGFRPFFLAAAVHVESKSTSSLGVGVWGSHAGTGYGVYGTAASGGYGLIGVCGVDGNNNGWSGFFSSGVYVGTQLGIGVVRPAFPIEHNSGARLTAGGVWVNAWDRNL